ncbi:trypsin-1 [Nasonia vitripennis]|uniref:Peptidase S1 domain-containing protein n=1 Tax=Nasonia vitripennis TaxID=7425 RepID=A0A7M7G8Q7_NASVI|nr:trypsin-1 [Nasonia vitripennis]
MFLDDKGVDPSLRIIGGNDAGIHEVPYTVSLRVFDRHFCGGSIISRNWIVSAAHCFLPVVPIALVRIRSGSSFSNFAGTMHSISRVYSHENFTLTNRGSTIHDIAVVRVSPSFQLNKSTRRPIGMFEPGQKAPDNAVGVLSGWGVLHETDNKMSYVLQKVEIPLVPKSKCRELLRKYGGLAKGQFCAGFMSGGKDACQGDSGGPFVVGRKLYGLVSWGKGCARRYLPGAYTEISFYRQWIKKYTGV